MLAAADLPEEFAGPVGFSGAWVWLAVGALGLVVVYYAVVLLLGLRRGAGADARAWHTTPDIRHDYFGRIQQVEDEVRSGALPARAGHQRLSEIVRSYVEKVSPLPATRMALADFRLQAPHLVDALTVMYPPEFAPDDDGRAVEVFDEALDQARQVVGR
ncbi:hypothetical protein [Nocardioides sambongensis]|uniref:hypothetical protein n=1 Tax=Nocardioides sambongensis TaxID=2589074 RepID=UPI001129EA5A|nr:hypothetical protein [Nocardioides sambongensis]